MTRIFLLIALVFIALPCLADDAGNDKPKLAFTTMYAYETSASQKNGAVFGTLHNICKQDIKIVKAGAFFDDKNEVAKRVELHTHEMDEGGMMMMRQVESFDIAPDNTLTLEPTGDHIMMIGLNAPLKENDRFLLVLESDQRRPFFTTVTVFKAGTPPEEVEQALQNANAGAGGEGGCACDTSCVDTLSAQDLFGLNTDDSLQMSRPIDPLTDTPESLSEDDALKESGLE